jgi:large subunit ribosomal protein L1
MSKITNKQKIILEKLDTEKTYSIDEAIKIIQSVKSEKFDESVDISVKLGVDSNKSDQNVRGAVSLPNILVRFIGVYSQFYRYVH